jgi:hypothetical protein
MTDFTSFNKTEKEFFETGAPADQRETDQRATQKPGIF